MTDPAPRTLVTNAPPAVTIAPPAQGTVLAVGQPFTVAAAASDPDDSVQRVEFSYNGGIPMGTLSAPPYQLAAPSGVPAGTYTVTARAFDTRGLWTDAVPVTCTVTSGDGGAARAPGAGGAVACAASATRRSRPLRRSA